MPTYGYVCDGCGQELEAFQKMSDAPLRTCPACGEDRLRRQIFATGIVFKGSGFYKTDYAAKSNGSGSKSSSENGSENGSESGSKSGSEKAPETKAEPAKSESGSGDKAAPASD